MENLMGQTAYLQNPNPKPLSVFINQLDGGYTLNLQGNEFYPVKVCVTLDEVKQIIETFFQNESTKATPPAPQEAQSVTDSPEASTELIPEE